MSNHPETEQLSAYADGELGVEEVRALDAHIVTCSECRATLAAIRSAISDVQSLPAPELSAEAIAALDAAIARERSARRMGGRRWTVIAGSAAAAVALIAVFAILKPTGGSSNNATALHKELAGAGTTGGSSATTDYTEETLAQTLSTLSSTTNDAAAPAVAAGQYGGERSAQSPVPDMYALSAGDEPLTKCATEIERANGDVVRVRAENARFKGQPAVVLFYLRPRNDPTFAEVWVLRPADCFTLYFAQARL